MKRDLTCRTIGPCAGSPLCSPTEASSSAPSSPTSVRPRWERSTVAPLSGERESASSMCRLVRAEGDGEEGRTGLSSGVRVVRWFVSLRNMLAVHQQVRNRGAGVSLHFSARSTFRRRTTAATRLGSWHEDKSQQALWRPSHALLPPFISIRPRIRPDSWLELAQ
jgi:hypothetical protein